MRKIVPFTAAAIAVGLAVIVGLVLTKNPICLFGLWVEWPIMHYAFASLEYED